MADPLIGAVVGERYRLTEEIGAGGMATVYRGEHLLLRKPVAVKVLLPDLSGKEDMAARFEREAIAAARLEHPNIVSITDFGRTPDGRLFLVMEFLEGTCLSDLIADELHLGWERAVEITRQVLRGLAHAHEVGIVHRDLKPSNVMVMAHPGGREIAKIIDFGIAKIVGDTSLGPHVETEAGLVFGTADFLAPERLQGKGESDPRADIYSAGVILYEALTGQRPFHHDEVLVTVQRALNESAKPPSQLVPGVPAELDAVVARAMAKRPEDRYPSARAMLNGLDPFARRSGRHAATTGGRAVVQPPPGGKERRAAEPPPVPAASSAAGEMVASSDIIVIPRFEDTPAEPSIGDSLSAVPLAPYQSAPRKHRRLLWLLPIGAAAVVFVSAVASRGPLGGGISAIAPPRLAAEAPAVNPAAGLEATIKQAAEGATVDERQRAFDRLVALGYSDRVPWLAMLSKDLEQLPGCEERREVIAKIRKLRDPAALPVLQKAVDRPDNGCLAGDGRAAMAALGGTAAQPAASNAAPAAAPKKKRARGGGGGHF